MGKWWKRGLIGYLVGAMLVIGTAQAYAGFSPSQAVGLLAGERSADLGRIQTFLESRLVGERLKALGFSADEVQARLAQFSDRQLHEIALRLDRLQVGGDALAVLIPLVVVLLIVALVLVGTGRTIVIK